MSNLIYGHLYSDLFLFILGIGRFCSTEFNNLSFWRSSFRLPRGGGAGIAFYFLFNILLFRFVNNRYLFSLQQIYSKYKDFNPDADTAYFSISALKLFILVVLTGSLYVYYWAYQNFKAIRDCQKYPNLCPFPMAFFVIFTSGYIFKAMARSLKNKSVRVGIPPVLAAVLFFVFSRSYSLLDTFFLSGKSLSIETILLVAWESLFAFGGIVASYQARIIPYLQQKKETLPIIKKSKILEIFLILFGLYINFSLVYVTTLWIIAQFI